jgi:hypothetical protein
VGSVFGPVRFLLPVCRLSWSLYTLNIYANFSSDEIYLGRTEGRKTLPTIWGTYMKLVTKYQISAINSCWEKCDEKCAYMFNVYKNQLSPEGGGGILFYLCPSFRPSFRPSKICFVAFFSATIDDRDLIFGISVINSCWEKSDEKCAYMFNAYKNQLSRQTGSRILMVPKTLYLYDAYVFWVRFI